MRVDLYANVPNDIHTLAEQPANGNRPQETIFRLTQYITAEIFIIEMVLLRLHLKNIKRGSVYDW